MKKIILSISTVLATLILLPALTFAAPSQTDITGVVTNNGKDVSGAKVVVVCDNHSKSTKTDSTGTYLVTFPIANCKSNTDATVVATYKGLGGVNSGKVNPVTTKLNVAIVNVSLPELGTIVGFTAAIIGGGAFLVIRRRQLGSH